MNRVTSGLQIVLPMRILPICGFMRALPITRRVCMLNIILEKRQEVNMYWVHEAISVMTGQSQGSITLIMKDQAICTTREEICFTHCDRSLTMMKNGGIFSGA